MTVEEMLLGNKVKTTPPGKFCYTCREHKSLEDFSKGNGKYNLSNECKICFRDYSKKRRYKNIIKYNKGNRERYYQLKLQILEAYGNKCNCCGESNKNTLQLDHIYNDGAKERKGRHKKYINANCRNVYYMLKNLNYPKGRHQLLCANCNHIKAKLGRCNCQDYKKEIPNLSNVEDYVCL